MFENLSDEALLVVWERTRRMLSTSADGTGPPDYPESQYRFHIAAEEALARRGFVENPPGIWVRPAPQPVTTAVDRS
jgi:hypothetical protein